MSLNILVCVKRVPATGAKITLTADEQEIDTRHLAFTVSPHEECAVEEAVRLVEKHGGSATVLTLGPEEATQQLRDALAMGVEHALLLETDGADWDPQATTEAIVDAIREAEEKAGQPFDLLLFGNEAADTGGYQVPIRVSHTLDRPCVTGIKGLEIDGEAGDRITATARRETTGGWELYAVSTPAVFSVKEGINLPRYPPLRGKLRAKKKPIQQTSPAYTAGGLQKIRLRVPEEQAQQAQHLGSGVAAVPNILAVLKEMEFVES
jgi:electron transfer flavoprotein beta subunit